MKKDDLISRAAAIEAFDDERVDRNYGDVSPESVIKVIESIPAVDAAQVVRCGDCEFYGEEPIGTLKECYRGCGWTKPSDYCSRGKRRESE